MFARSIMGPVGSWYGGGSSWPWGPLAGFSIFLIIVLAAWVLVWKGLSLWRSARAGQKGWFIALLLFNTLGLLPIVYLAFFQKKAKKK